MIKQNKLSLTKKLDGGYLHVKKSPNKLHVKKGGYSDYLHKQTAGIKPSAIKSSVNNSSNNKHTGGNRKIVSVQLKSPKKKISPKKVKKEVKDIPDILPKRVEKKNNQAKQPQAKQPQAKQPQAKQPQAKQPQTKKLQPKRGLPIQIPKAKGSLKKQHVMKRLSNKSNKSKGRRLNKSLTKRRNHSLKKGKRISVTKTRKYSKKDISKIQSKINDIKKKSNNEIKKELEKQGVKLSGKSPEIMKDVYMYSQLCGINIKRE